MYICSFDDPFIEECDPYDGVMQNRNFDKTEDGFMKLFLDLVERHPEEYEKEFEIVFNRTVKDSFGTEVSGDKKETES